MATQLTARQRELLDYIEDFITDKGYPPTIRELAAGLGFHRSTIVDHLKALEKKGYIRHRPGLSRSIEILEHREKRSAGERIREIPILGRIAAGKPLLAIENLEGTISLDRDWVKGEDLFFLRVKGDSMIDAHIMEGDLALVKAQPVAENGDIVVALIEDEATLKRFYQEKACSEQSESNYIRLRPANPALEDIIIKAGDKRVQIIGKVLGIMRRYR